MSKTLVGGLLPLVGGCSLLVSIPDISSGLPTQGDAAVDARGEKEADTPDALPPASYAATVIADGPRVLYRFDETSGSVATDAIGGPAASIGSGCTPGVAGVVSDGAALDFDGSTCAVTTTTPLDFDQRSPFTFEMWIKPRNVAGAAYRMLFSRDGDTAGRQQFGAYVREGQLVFERWVGGLEVTAAAPITAGVFTHVALVYDGGQLLVYLDGQKASSALDARAQAKKPSPMAIGFSGLGESFFAGAMDEFAIYDKALSAERIRQHVEAGKPR